MKIEMKLGAFSFPNFIDVEVGGTVLDKMGVGNLTPEQAGAYWDELKPLWIAHVEKRKKFETELLTK